MGCKVYSTGCTVVTADNAINVNISKTSQLSPQHNVPPSCMIQILADMHDA